MVQLEASICDSGITWCILRAFGQPLIRGDRDYVWMCQISNLGLQVQL